MPNDAVPGQTIQLVLEAIVGASSPKNLSENGWDKTTVLKLQKLVTASGREAGLLGAA